MQKFSYILIFLWEAIKSQRWNISGSVSPPNDLKWQFKGSRSEYILKYTCIYVYIYVCVCSCICCTMYICHTLSETFLYSILLICSTSSRPSQKMRVHQKAIRKLSSNYFVLTSTTRFQQSKSKRGTTILWPIKLYWTTTFARIAPTALIEVHR